MSENLVNVDRKELFLKGMKRFIIKYLEKRSGLWQKSDNPGGRSQTTLRENCLLSLSER